MNHVAYNGKTFDENYTKCQCGRLHLCDTCPDCEEKKDLARQLDEVKENAKELAAETGESVIVFETNSGITSYDFCLNTNGLKVGDELTYWSGQRSIVVFVM